MRRYRPRVYKSPRPSKSTYGPKWDYLKDLCKRRAGYRCQKCGWAAGKRERNRLDSHHITPRSKGGTDTLDNLICLCKDCHTAEHPHMQRKR